MQDGAHFTATRLVRAGTEKFSSLYQNTYQVSLTNLSAVNIVLTFLHPTIVENRAILTAK